MEFAYLLGGGAPVIKKYQIGEAMADAGVPVIAESAQATAGIALASTTASLDFLGVTLDTQGTLVTAQQSDNSDPARLVSVIINPDAVWKAKLTNGATANTALTLRSVTLASTNGLLVTTGDDFNGTDFDGGTLWGFDGNNATVARRITATTSTSATVIVAFPNDTVVGDNFLRCGPHEGQDVGVTLTTDLTQVDAEIAHNAGNDNFRVVEGQFRDVGNDGQNNSFLLLVGLDHLYGNRGAS